MRSTRVGTCSQWALILTVTLAIACDREGDRQGELGVGVTAPPDNAPQNGGGTGGASNAGCRCRDAFTGPPTSEWAEVQPPSGFPNFVATDSFAVGRDDIYFAGQWRTALTDSPSGALLRWTRGCWTTELTSGAGALTDRASIHGTSSGHLFATLGDTIYQRQPGGSWAAFDATWTDQIELPWQRDLSLTRIRAVSSSELWATETNAILHYADGAWTTYQLNVGEPGEGASIRMGFLDIWVLGANAVWVAGGSDQVGSTMDPAYLHRFDGTTWSSTVVARYGVTSIWPVDGSLWYTAPGNFGDPDGDGFFEPVSLFRYDVATGSSVSFVAAGVPEERQIDFSTLWAPSATEIWASGQDVARFDGYEWSAVSDLPEAARGTSRNPVFVTGDPESIWLVAPGPRFFRKAHD